MSEASIDAVFEQAIRSLSLEEQYVLAQRITDRYVEQTRVTPQDLPDDEVLRLQREAIERTHGMFEGSADASRRHDEIVYGRAKP